ncbi:MAG TPA: serine hydrolase domain-containing protein [Steroidobacteraceae bacterium]|nr:serine hydrolase domain-containing protein [Steroidobacteraceae bacterium]
MMTRRSLLGAGAALALANPAMLRAGESRDAARFDAVGEAVKKAVTSRDVPGALSVVWQGGKVRCIHAAGVRSVETGAPLAMDTIMGLASMTKPITVATAMALVDRGKMRLTDPITKWAPEFTNMRVLRRADGALDDTYPAPRVITIQDLMTHCAGFAYGFYTQGPLAVALIQKLGMGIESNLTADQWMQTIAALPLAYAPGERSNYGHSIDVLGFIVGRAAGSDLRRAMRELVLDPTGMPDTDFHTPLAKQDRAAAVYFSPAVGEFTSVKMSGFYSPTPASYASGGQGLVSTAADYLRFARMMLAGGKIDGRRVLKADSVKQMATDHLTAEQRRLPAFGDGRYWDRWGQGLGMTVLRDPALAATKAGVGSFGWAGAFGGWWQADPTRDAILLWMQECLPAPPIPGAPPAVRDIPGINSLREFQARAYTALG